MAQEKKRVPQAIVLLTLASGVAGAIGVCLAKRVQGTRPTEGKSAKLAEGDIPRRIEPLVPTLFEAESDEAVCVQRILRSTHRGPRNIPYCCHLIRLYGWGPVPGPHFSSGREILGALTDQETSEKVFGEAAFFQTRSGIRYRTLQVSSGKGAENHRDICLATFAEAGLSLSAEFTMRNGRYHLSDLLNDSVQNFHLHQNELPWTAVAYALYPRLGDRWCNRFGESFGWDDLTNALLDAPLERSSCGGTHVLYALMLLYRVDREKELSGLPRTRLHDRLKMMIASACAKQAGDGHWPLDWWTATEGRGGSMVRELDHSPSTQLLITGHLLECLTLAPSELQPPMDVYRRGARWLCQELQKDRVKWEGSICPITHAVCAIRSLIKVRKE